MITDSFDNQTAAKINPQIREDAPGVDACIVTFSYLIEKFVLENYECRQIGQLYSVTGITPVYQINYNNKKFAFYKTCVGAPASDYIRVSNAPIVAKFMEENKIPCAMGKTWTTDALYRETTGNIEKRKADGCISVEMECAGLQAMCNFRNLELYMFFTSGDLLDAPEWDARCKNGQLKGTQHDTGHFNIAIALADYVSSFRS